MAVPWSGLNTNKAVAESHDLVPRDCRMGDFRVVTYTGSGFAQNLQHLEDSEIATGQFRTVEFRSKATALRAATSMSSR